MCAHEAALAPDSHTAVDWANFCREECLAFNLRNTARIGGVDSSGTPIIVEIDESFFHRKYNWGQLRTSHWFGDIERYSNKCFLIQVADRRATTLEAEIWRYIEPGSPIMSDMWAAYANIDTIGNGVFLHSSINHSQNFVHPIDREIHTQTIENMWMRAKRKLKKQFGTSETLFSTYLDEFTFRCTGNQEVSVFARFIVALRHNYP